MKLNEAKKIIAELTDKINYHSDLALSKNKSEISDREFDELLAQLADLEKQFPELHYLTQ